MEVKTGLYRIHLIYFTMKTLILLSLSAAFLVFILTRKYPEKRRLVWRKYTLYTLFVWVHFLAIYFGKLSYYVFLTLIFIGTCVELFCASFSFSTKKKLTHFSLLILGFIALFYWVHWVELKWIWFNFILMVTFNGFGQIAHQFVGKTRIASISRSKTWEGFIVALAMCMILFKITTVFDPVSYGFEGFSGYLYVLTLCLCFLFSDLYYSKIKRKSKLKYYSKLLKENGGILDRYDVLIGAAFFHAILVLFNFY